FLAMSHCATCTGRAPWAVRLILVVSGPISLDWLQAAAGPACRSRFRPPRPAPAAARAGRAEAAGGRSTGDRGGTAPFGRAGNGGRAGRGGRRRAQAGPCRKGRPQPRPALPHSPARAVRPLRTPVPPNAAEERPVTRPPVAATARRGSAGR